MQALMLKANWGPGQAADVLHGLHADRQPAKLGYVHQSGRAER